MIAGACVRCGTTFLTDQSSRKYCSEKCGAATRDTGRREQRSARSRERYASDPVYRRKKDAQRAESVKRVRARVGHNRPAGSLYRSDMETRVAPAVLAAGGEYEPVRLVYAGKPRGYYPDFVLANGIAIEVKGWFQAKDRSKMLLVKEQYPALDIRMVLASPQQFITKRRLLTQAQWCEKHGFPWAKNEVPQAWIDEPTNAASKSILDNAPKRKGKVRNGPDNAAL